MSVNYDCFDGVIGLSRVLCECYDSPPEDYDISYSGLYLDELEPLDKFSGQLTCENGADLWELMDKCREQAIIAMKTDISALLLQNYKLRRQPFYGSIGNFKSTDTLTLDTGYFYGIRMMCANIVGGIIRINKIGAIFSGTQNDVPLYVYNNLNELITVLHFDTQAGLHQITTLSGELELPMHSPYTENIEYYFVYKENEVTSLPRNIKVKCDCGHFKAVFDTKEPYFIDSYHPHPKSFDSHSNNAYGWSKYVMVGAVVHSDTDLDFSNITTSASNYTYGLTLPDIEFRCKVSELLCDDTTLMDYEANPLALAIAHLIRYKAGELCINGILQSKNINLETMINREELDKCRGDFRIKYGELALFISENLNIAANDCLACKDNVGIHLGGILA